MVVVVVVVMEMTVPQEGGEAEAEGKEKKQEERLDGKRLEEEMQEQVLHKRAAVSQARSLV